jgi:hypothetical protein
MSTPEPQDRVIWRKEIYVLLGGVCSETVRLMLKSGRLPAPDVSLSKKTMGWKQSTLQKIGII